MIYILYTDLDVHFQSSLRFQSLGVPGSLPLMIILNWFFLTTRLWWNNLSVSSTDHWRRGWEVGASSPALPGSYHSQNITDNHKVKTHLKWFRGDITSNHKQCQNITDNDKQGQNSLRMTKQTVSHIMTQEDCLPTQISDQWSLWWQFYCCEPLKRHGREKPLKRHSREKLWWQFCLCDPAYCSLLSNGTPVPLASTSVCTMVIWKSRPESE